MNIVLTLIALPKYSDNQVHATLGPMMYDPNVFTINLEQLLSSAPIGELQVINPTHYADDDRPIQIRPLAYYKSQSRMLEH